MTGCFHQKTKTKKLVIAKIIHILLGLSGIYSSLCILVSQELAEHLAMCQVVWQELKLNTGKYTSCFKELQILGLEHSTWFRRRSEKREINAMW